MPGTLHVPGMATQQTADPWVTMREATKHLSCSTDTLEGAIRRGELQATKLGSGPRAQYRFRLSWLDDWAMAGLVRVA